MLTVTYTKSLHRSPDCALGIEGIDEIKTFNMKIPTVEVKPHLMNFTKYTGKNYTLHKKPIIRFMHNVSFFAGYSRDKVTMPKLLHLPLQSSTEFIDIPKVIGARSRLLAHFLRVRYRPPQDHEALARESDSLRWRFYNNIISRFYRTSDHELSVPANEEQICCEILQQWITTLDRSQYTEYFKSSLLADALHRVGVNNSDLLYCLKSYSDPLTMSIIRNFPVTTNATVNIPREVGVRYFDFGTHLLQDTTGAFIRSLEIELKLNSECINQRILQQWLNGEGRPVSWATLVEILNIIQMGELAKKIEDKYITAPT